MTATQSSCCAKPEEKIAVSSCCDSNDNGGGKSKPDYFLWANILIILPLYFQSAFWVESITFASWYEVIAQTVFELINTMWLSIIIGMLMVGVLAKIPREFVMSILGTAKGPQGIVRATFAGVLLDLCNHGILMVGSKLYERGASIGQVMAFLIASPWNSLSLTLILIALIGLPWTLAFIVLSMLIGISVGLLFNILVRKNVLPDNPHSIDLPDDFQFWASAKKGVKKTKYNGQFFSSLLLVGVKDSRMVLRWVFFGVLLAAMIRAFVPGDIYTNYFGPSLLGLLLTVIAATIIEVCSEGSTPIAADLLTRANAPGNSFTFLMAGAATDYTEVMVLKDTTKSWKVALFLPLLTVPQVLLVAWIINQFSM